MSAAWREVAPYALIACLAAPLRLLGLGIAPLNASEAAGAWIAWTQARGSGFAGVERLPWGEASPLLMSAQWLLFELGGAGEAMARLPAAACGIALALVPLLLRSILGTSASLALAVALAIVPASVAAGRHADGAVVSGLCALFTAAALWRSLAPSAAKAGTWRRAAAAGTGLLLVSGPHAWDFITVLLAWPLMTAAVGAAPARHEKEPVGRIVTGAALLGATGFLAAPALAGAVSAGLTAWLQQGPAAMSLILAATLAVSVLLAAIRGERGLFFPRARELPAAAMATLAVIVMLDGSRRASATSGPEPRRLAADIERLSIERTGDPHELPVLVVGRAWPDPLLGWSLRRMRHVRFAEVPRALDRQGRPLVVEATREASGPRLDLEADHVGARYAIASEPVILWVPR